MRLIFLGSGEFGLPTLRRLCERHDVVGVVSQPDRQAGRKRALTATPITTWAMSAGMAVLKSDNVNDPAFIEQIAALNADAAVVIAFGQKLSPELIGSLGGLAVNLHASLLPKYRGAAPINWAMINGEAETGASVIELAQRMDAGRIYATAATAIDPNETAGELHDRLAELGPNAIDRVLNDFTADKLTGEVQDESRATKAPKLTKADGTTDFNAPAEQIRNRIHGLTPWPGVRVKYVETGGECDTGRVILLRRVAAVPDLPHQAEPGTLLEDFHVATNPGAIRLVEVQAPGGRPLPIHEYARGHRVTAGDRLKSTQ